MNKKLDLEVGIIKNVYDSSSINKIRENILYKYNDNLPSKNIFNLETYLFDMVFNDVSVNYFKNILQEFVLLPENTLSIGKFNVAHRDTTSFEAGGLKIHYGRMNGKGIGVNMTCESKHYKFTFNIRNKQASGAFPTHMMCDYKKKAYPKERPENGVV